MKSQTPDPYIQIVEKLLEQISLDFYQHCDNPKAFYRDRTMLLYALSWPAKWLDERSLQMEPRAYGGLIEKRLKSIINHGDPERYGGYFPNYLLKCLQDWFAWHGEDLYMQLKDLRNSMWKIDSILEALKSRTETSQPATSITTLAQTHQLLHGQRKRKAVRSLTDKQLELF